MNAFFREKKDEALRFDFKVLEQPTPYHTKRREDTEEERILGKDDTQKRGDAHTKSNLHT